jgi:hypothetical protein
MISHSNLADLVRGGVMIGIAFAIVCLFWGLGCLCGDVPSMAGMGLGVATA